MNLKSLKKILSISLALGIAMTVMSGCKKGDDTDADPKNSDTVKSVDENSALQSKVAELESKVESLRLETVTQISMRNKTDYILGKDNPAVSEAVAIKEKIMADLPETILIQGKEYSTKLTVLTLSNMNLTNEDIEELKYMVYLEELQIYQNKISDLTPLKGLTNLKILSLFKNEISDLSPLSGLVQLEALYLRANKLTDISPIDGLYGLTMLDLSENAISDITPLSGMTELTLLRLNDNKITSISSLGNMKKMSRLHLQNNSIEDISSIQNMIEITEIYLNSNKIKSIEPIRSLTSMGWLKLGYNPIVDLRPVATLTELKKLYIEGVTVDKDTMTYITEELPKCTIVTN